VLGVAPHLLLEMFKLEAGRQHRARALSGHGADADRDRRRRSSGGRGPDDHLPAAHPVRQDARHRRRGPSAHADAADVPTTKEAGYPKIDSPFWLGVVAPAGTPPDIIKKLNAAFRESLDPAPETRARLATLGAEIKIGSPEDFGKMLAKELALWTDVVKDAHIKVE